MSAEPETYPTPAHGWTCYHCGETFAPHGIGRTLAREHFGATPDHEPGCLLKLNNADRSLLSELRSAQEDLKRYWQEDSEKDRQLRRLTAEHEMALRRAEEIGYGRGLNEATHSLMGALTADILRFGGHREECMRLRGVNNCTCGWDRACRQAVALQAGRHDT